MNPQEKQSLFLAYMLTTQFYDIHVLVLAKHEEQVNEKNINLSTKLAANPNLITKCVQGDQEHLAD